jgi:hypothetical protein
MVVWEVQTIVDTVCWNDKECEPGPQKQASCLLPVSHPPPPSAGGVVGLAATPPLALLVGLPGAFLVTGLVGMAWAVWGARTLPQTTTTSSRASSSSSSRKSGSAAQAAASGQQQQQQQQQQQKGGLQRLLQLPRSTLVQLAVLCYSHAVMGYCFFILQVGADPCQEPDVQLSNAETFLGGSVP